MKKEIEISKKSGTFDAQKLSEITRLCIGTRTVTEYAKRVGISRQYIQKMLSGNMINPPRQRTLLRMASPDAAPQNDVTIEDFYRCCGYRISEDSIVTDTAGKARTLPEAITAYYNRNNRQIPATALHILLNGLLANGLECDFSIELKADFVRIKGKKQIYVGIPAFCDDKNGEEAIRLGVVLTMMRLMKDGQKDIYYYVITDTQSMYQDLIQMMKEVNVIQYAVIRTENDRTVCEEYYSAENRQPFSLMYQ